MQACKYPVAAKVQFCVQVCDGLLLNLQPFVVVDLNIFELMLKIEVAREKTKVKLKNSSSRY
jgi:hypothetical protein